jgi:hypothetical protein
MQRVVAGPDRARFLLAGMAVLAIVVGAGALSTRLAGGTAPGPVPRFVDVTAASGLDVMYDGGFRQSAGGGLAAFDCDNDGRQDVYVAGGDNPAALFHNDSTVGGEIRFSRLRDAATDLTKVNGAYPIDIDGDGNVDLVTLRDGENVVLRGLGNCHFERANERWNLDGGNAQTMAFSATWESGSSWPTLAFGTYVDPSNFDLDTRCGTNVLLRPATAGAGAAAAAGAAAGPRYASAIPLRPSYCALSMLFSAWGGTGPAGLRVSNDQAFYRQEAGQEQLWRLPPDGPPRVYTAAEGWARLQLEGMGIASYDLTGDGHPEIYLTSQGANRLQTLATAAPSASMGPDYVDIGLDRGVNVAHPSVGSNTNLPSTSWHPEFADVNDDGLIDLFVSKGNVTDVPDYALEDPSVLLLGRPDGTFEDVAQQAGIVVMDRGRGAALVDFNLDGRLDLVESFYGAPTRVWQNATVPVGIGGPGAPHWLALQLRDGSSTNRDAIGAVVDIRAGGHIQSRELTIGGGHASGELGWLHVGLGTESSAEVRVRWPDGQQGPWMSIPVDRFSIVDRSFGVQAWTPPQ